VSANSNSPTPSRLRRNINDDIDMASSCSSPQPTEVVIQLPALDATALARHHHFRDLLPAGVTTVKVRADKKFSTKNPYHIDALYGHAAGTISSAPCETCSLGIGRHHFVDCVASDRIFQGACTNCRAINRDALCTFRSMLS
jgi:Protein of unknown function (DUF3716)